MPFSQSSRMLAIGTALGDGVVAISAFHGREEMGRLFEYEAELLSDDANLSFDDMIGSTATVRLETQHNGTRFFSGIVSRFVQLSTGSRYTRYRATLVPWFWLLTRTSNCRIFQTKTVPEIIESIFRERGFEAYENRLTGSYPAWEYCVQYRETDFNFISRLMEQEGIYYYFTHEDGKHTLVMADSSDAHQETPGYGSIEYRQQTKGASDGERIRTWTQNRELMPGSFTHADFNFKKPKTIIRAEPVLANREHSNANYELYDYPGEFADASQAKRLAAIRLQEQQARYTLVQGDGDTRGLAAGAIFRLQEHPRDDQNASFLIVAVTHHAEVSGFEADGGTANDSYKAGFVVMPASEHFRSARSTPQPTIAGPQTAIVVGPANEEIHTDEFGRVKVSFHWDRYSKSDDKSSCWVRVSQSWAGKKWGAIYIPRIGQEVIVEFLEGDPDKPIITGRVYNGECQPPYDLPAQKTKSTLKSNSSKGGEGFNEIRFEDKKGEEQIFIHGQKDLDVRVRNDVRETNYGNRDVRVGWEKDGATGGSLTTTVRKDVNTHVQGSRLELVEKDQNLTVQGGVVEDFQKAQTTLVKETYQLNAKEVIVEGGQLVSHKSGKVTVEGATGVHIKGAMVAIEGSTGVSLKVGGNFVSINPAGVSINGTLVMINSGGAALPVEAAKSVVAPEVQVPPDARIAAEAVTGNLSKTEGTTAPIAKVALKPQKSPAFVPAVSSMPKPVEPPPAHVAIRQGNSECHLTQLTIDCGKAGIVSAKLPGAEPQVGLKPTDKRRDLCSSKVAVLEVVAPFMRQGDKKPAPLKLKVSGEWAGRCACGKHPLISVVAQGDHVGAGLEEFVFLAPQSREIEVYGLAMPEDSLSGPPLDLRPLWFLSEAPLRTFQIRLESCGHHPSQVCCCAAADALVRVYRDETWELSFKLPALRKYSASGSVADDGSEFSLSASGETFTGEKTGGKLGGEKNDKGNWDFTGTAQYGRSSSSFSSSEEGFSTSSTQSEPYAFGMIQKDTTSTSGSTKQESHFVVRPSLSLKHNGLELPFTEVVNQVLAVAQSVKELLKFVKDLSEVVKIGWSVSMELSILEGSIKGSWGLRASKEDATESFKWVQSFFDLSIDIVLIGLNAKAMFGFEVKSPAFLFWSEGALAEGTAKVELNIKAELKPCFTFNLKNAPEEVEPVAPVSAKIELYGKVYASVLGLSVGIQLGVEGGLKISGGVRLKPRLGFPYTIAREVTVAYAAFVMPFKGRASPRHELELWAEDKNWKTGVIEFGKH